jgi:Helix-turn-helix domain
MPGRRTSRSSERREEPIASPGPVMRSGSSVTIKHPADRSVSPWLQPELYRIRDAGVVLGVSERMVYEFIQSGALMAVHLPTTGTKGRPPVRIARADLLAFVERCRGGVLT